MKKLLSGQLYQVKQGCACGDPGYIPVTAYHNLPHLSNKDFGDFLSNRWSIVPNQSDFLCLF